MSIRIIDRQPSPALGLQPVAWLLAFFVVMALQLAADSVMVKPYDEGLILYGASRVSNGELPYRDFWSMYGPGSFYVLAGLDKLFGESVLVGRVFDAVVRSGMVLLVYALSWRQAGRSAAATGAFIAFMLLIAVRDYLLPAFPAAALAMLALYATDRVLWPAADSLRSRSRSWSWAWPGAAVGAALLFRHDFGVYAAIACLWAMLSSHQKGGRIGRSLAAFVVGLVVVAGPLIVWLAIGVPAADLYENLVRIPLQAYVPNRSLPFPNPILTLQDAVVHHAGGPALPLAVYVPVLVAIWALALVAYRRIRGAPSSERLRAAHVLFESLLVLQLFFCLKGSVRVQLVHMTPAFLVAIVLVTLAMSGRRWPAANAVRMALLVVGLAAGTYVTAGRVRAAQAASQPPMALVFADLWRCQAAGLARLGCFAMDADRTAVLQYLQEHARPGDTLYMGTGRHDKLFINNVELYFLSGLPAATKWHDLHPGVQTNRAVQVVMIEELKRKGPTFAVLNTQWDDWQEPNNSRNSGGATLLDDYLREHYKPIFTAGTFVVSVRRDGVPMAPGIRP